MQEDPIVDLLAIALESARDLGRNATAYELLGAIVARCSDDPGAERALLAILPSVLSDLGISRN